MSYHSLHDCLKDLERTKRLIRIDDEVDPYLEIAAIQRRVYERQGPALLFTRVKGTSFSVASNIYGTLDRTRFIFRKTLKTVETFLSLKVNPEDLAKKPWKIFRLFPHALHVFPKKVRTGPILNQSCSVSDLPLIQSWPKDGGAFITLPQVYTESVGKPGFRASNLGMYRIQLSGNQYAPNQEIGLHYQIHRGIGIHHQEAIDRHQPLHVNIFVGGTPAMTLSAVMPLPEGMPELYFAGLLAGHRIPMITWPDRLPMYAEADFCISGTIMNKMLPEGPFGDHLGYYSLTHDFPVLKVDHIYHRKNAIWPSTCVGRPPQEDTSFGAFIHELTGPVIPTVIPGIKAVHAVDAAGVHPLLLAIGSERYTPYQNLTHPQEIMTQASALLGQGQLSLAKYLLITNHHDNPALDIHDIPAYLRHLLERIDWTHDVHFLTKTTMDTLDYSGEKINEGSKVILAAVGNPKRKLGTSIPSHFQLPEGFSNPKIAFPGILTIQGPKVSHLDKDHDESLTRFTHYFNSHNISDWPLWVIVDDSEFTARTLNNFLWVTFTRSDPARDIHGLSAFTQHKHWGCHGPLVIDARIKPHHAPVLEDDPAIEKRLNSLREKSSALAKWL